MFRQNKTTEHVSAAVLTGAVNLSVSSSDDIKTLLLKCNQNNQMHLAGSFKQFLLTVSLCQSDNTKSSVLSEVRLGADTPTREEQRLIQ